MKDGVKDAAGATTVGGGRERRQGALRQGLARRLAPNGHLAIAAALKSGGITHVYSLPGNPMYATLGACVGTGLTVIGCRSQFGALSAALAHNFQVGKLCAVAICSPSPGVTNCITSLSDAKSNQWPMLLIGGVVEPSQAQAAPAELGGDQGGAMFQSFAMFQNFDGARAVAPCCKAVMQLRDREALFAGITRALEQAQTAPCGPVFVEVGPTVLNTRHHDAAVALRHSKPAQGPSRALLRQVSAREGRSRVLSSDAVAPSPSVGELLARAFDHYGDQPALRCGDLRLSYGDLDRASAAWARTLVQAPGSVGDLVALALPRGADFVAALIRILRAGRAFVPLSPQDPPERLKRILQQAAPKHLIAQADLAQALEFPALKPEEAAKAAAPFADLAPEDLAYVMFTSGSTGTPKSVAVPHRALANYLAAVG